MKIIRMPVFAILILSAIPYLVSCSSETLPASAENKNSAGKASSNSASNSASQTAASKSASKSDGQITGKSIELPHYQPDFPPGEHKDLFVSRCGVCHSLRYVTMQPDFPKKTWAKEVDKMITTYGAHIDKKEAEAIIEYLNSIKGKTQSADKH